MGLYYEGSKKFFIEHPNIGTYLCAGQRGRGKTTHWLAQASSRAIADIESNDRTGKRFFYLRRSDEQLKKAISKGLFNGVFSVPKYRDMMRGFVSERIWNDRILLKNGDGNEILVGYISNLNNVKGQSVEDSDVLIFDEYIEPTRGAYKGGDGGINEPELLARLDETIFRNRRNWIIMLGNFDSPTNPYHEYFGIPYNISRYSDKKRGLFYERDVSEEMAKEKEQTSTGRRWSGTQYSEYSNGLISLGSANENLIGDKPPHAIHQRNFNICGVEITMWYDQKTDTWYFHDNYKFDKNKPIYTVLSKDMCVNSFFVSYNSDILMLLRMRYGRGQVMFNNQKTASLFQTMISLTK